MMSELRWRWIYFRHQTLFVWTEKLLMWLAWHLPKSLVEKATIRVFSTATTGKYGTSNPYNVDVFTALNRFQADELQKLAEIDH